MNLRPFTPAERYARYKAFLDDLADLRHLAVYPVTWTGDPDQLIHRVPLTGTQAQGFACIHCGGIDGAKVLAGVVQNTPGCYQIFAHEYCPPRPREG